MASQRDLGLQALQSGDVNAAIQLLETVCASDRGDYQAHIFLGAAYSQVNRTLDAINVLTRAVELQPSNAQARYNLGIAMERGGYPDQAVTAFEQAISLQPDYPKAREGIQRVRGSAISPPPTQSPAQQAHGSAPQYGAPVDTQALGGLPTAPAQTADSGLAGYNALPGPANQTMVGFGASPAANPYSSVPAQGPYPAQPPQTTYRPTPAPPTRTTQNSGIGMAILLGVIGGGIGTALWVGIILTTRHSSSWIGLIVGAIVGFLIKKGMGGGSSAGGIMASLITVLSSVAGNAIAASMLPTGSVLSSLGFSIAGIFISYRVASS